MALPGSGVLSLGNIATEQAIALSNVSLRSMSLAAGKSTPDAVSEFYSYTAYTYYATYSADNPCNYDSWDIYQGPSGMYYRQVSAGVYDPMYNYTNLWYEYLYYDSMFDGNVYAEYEINVASTVLTYNGDVFSLC